MVELARRMRPAPVAGARKRDDPTAIPVNPAQASNSSLEALHRCGQFVLGREPLPVPAHWPCLPIAPDLVLRAHPELAVTQLAAGGRTLTLVGHMLDPHDAQAGNEAILRRLAAQGADRRDLLRAAGSCGGRWLLIVAEPQGLFLFHDALGLRQAFFSTSAGKETPCVASDAGLVAEITGAEVDAHAQRFMQSAAFRNDPESAWPGDASAYRGVRRLLPNHLLDLREAHVVRFWPQAPLAPLKLSEAADCVAGLLQGLVRAAAQRFELVVAVTAGLDSRTVLAACRELGDRLTYATVHQWHQREDVPDVACAAAMLRALGLRHTVVRAGEPVDAGFARVFRANTSSAHAHYLPDAAALYAEFGRKKAALTGSGGEVGRCPFRERLPFFDRLPVTPSYLARIAGYGREPLALESFARWLEGLGPDYGINPLDLFMWEHDCGSWLATVEAEFDIAWAEILTPFNCRDLLAAMLAAPPAVRKGSRPALFNETIRRLWPQLLDFPVNPHLASSGPKQWLRNGMELVRYGLLFLRYGR